MRQVTLQVPAGGGDHLVQAARELRASTLLRLVGSDGDGEAVDVVVATVPNASVGPLIDKAQELGRIEASVPATGTFAFEPPAGEPPEELVDVTPRSGYEVVLAGRQAAGSWRGFLTYAAVAGAVVWLGLYTETIYLLTGSMLIAPFAGPAMNTAIAITSGRASMLRHAIFRYVAGILLTAATAGLLTWIVGQHVVTGLMTSVLTITAAAILLPIAAGVAGATFLVQSEHSSLISGAAVGILVAASLAPPAGGLGIAVALGRWSLAAHGAFLIALQLTGITVSAVTVLWLYGIRPGAKRFTKGRSTLLRAGLTTATLAAAGLVALQFATTPTLLQGSESRHAAEIVADAVAQHPHAELLTVDPTVTGFEVPGPPRIVVTVVVERRPGAPASEQLEPALAADLRERLRERIPTIVPHVRVTALPPPTEVTAAG